MPSIIPTVGRKVWYFPALSEGRGVPDQPLDATVCYVNVNGTVNLACHDQIGQSFTSLEVLLLNPDDKIPDGTGSYATWMPYQAQQAAKAEKQAQLEATNGLVSVADATAAAAPAPTDAPTQAPTEAPTQAPAQAPTPPQP